jgi:dodecin
VRGLVLRAAEKISTSKAKESLMEDDHVYKIIKLAGTSKESIDDAIKTAIKRAHETVRHMRWFEVEQMRGHIANGAVERYQVVLRVGFTMDEHKS